MPESPDKDLGVLWRGLQEEGADARNNWRDTVAERFKREYWDELESEMPQVLAAISEFEEALQHANLVLED